jgi:hypothetical protein
MEFLPILIGKKITTNAFFPSQQAIEIIIRFCNVSLLSFSTSFH